MAQNEIIGYYQNILGRAPDPGGLKNYLGQASGGRSLSDIKNEIYGSPEARGYRSTQQQQQIGQLFQNEITSLTESLTSTFQKQFELQQRQFAEAQKRQQELMKQQMAKMQQQSLETQRRQAAGTQTAQVLGGGKSLTIRPGASKKFSRPELQIKSVNI
jgi:ElaB/YqjD/DUF883 family membrane-anchored ribosome-binding protein|tara:strand:- start:88 stop:564 length:477 start_codon:yes stop_codon:yes gene_type:complete